MTVYFHEKLGLIHMAFWNQEGISSIKVLFKQSAKFL